METQRKQVNNEACQWLLKMFRMPFFGDCSRHANEKMNLYCTHCLEPLCSKCNLDHHRTHQSIQVRRYMYRCVINLNDMQNNFDCNGIQTYLNNGKRVVHLTKKENPEKNKQNSCRNFCLNCEHTLPESFQYCCLECKVCKMNDEEGETEDNEDVQAEPADLPTKEKISYRKRPRKQKNPRRSPFF